MGHDVLAGSLLLTMGLAIAGEPVPRTLPFEERVKAQEAIERVYYGHQIGATKAFEAAVPRAVLASKVRRYLDQTAALEMYWKTAITDEMLQCELERMARDTRMPGRLRELFHALGDDSVLIQECLARPALVDRLARESFARDDRIHFSKRAEAEQLRSRLVRSELSTESVEPHRFVESFRRVERKAEAADIAPRNSTDLEPGEFAEMRASAPDRVGAIGPLIEDRETFSFKTVLSVDARNVRIATYVIRKISWDDWWKDASPSLPRVESAPLAAREHPVPFPTTATIDSSWSPTSIANAPSARELPAAVWTGSLMIVWGGDSQSPLFHDTGGRYDPATDSWAPTTTTNAPAARAVPTAVWTGVDMVVWGGVDTTDTALNTGGRYDPLTDTWVATAAVGAPSPRAAHAVAWTGSVMLVWGGTDLSSNLNTGGRYDPVADSWTPVSTSNAPAARIWPGAVWTGSQLVVWGGHDDGPVDTGGRYDPTTDVWTSVTTTNAPSARYYFSTIWTGSEVIVWGGNGGAALRTGGRYDPATDVWTSTFKPGAPSARWWHSAVWTGSVMVVWGGFDYDNGSAQYDTGGIYDPATDIWAPTSTTDAPAARSYHRAVWTGSVMLIWGGWDGTYASYRQTGGLYAPEPSPDTADNDGDGFRERDGDCDDGRAEVCPAAAQLCDGLNNDCDDPAWPTVPANEADADGDGVRICKGDCDDADPGVHVGAVEVCNGLDDDCDDAIDTDPGALCNDANACTTDLCNGMTGCAHLNNVTTCDDFDACTTADFCAGGFCKQGDADLDGTGFSSGRVDGRDLAILAVAWNTCPGDRNYYPAANLDLLANAAGACIDDTDFHEFMNAFGRSCADRR